MCEDKIKRCLRQLPAIGPRPACARGSSVRVRWYLGFSPAELLCRPSSLSGYIVRDRSSLKALGTAAWPPEPPPEISKLGLFDIKEVNIQNGLYCIYLTMRCVDGGWDGGIDGSLKNQFSLKQIKDAMLDLPPVVVMRDVVAEVCEGKNVEDILWKNV